ncbi:MAG: DNA repair protein RecN [Deltaproteobacteria bacterium]|nr:DNA repair protein RecN [Deltaproteobacteria bacterium]MBW2445844.1 DNA repair protein RecN [Deltaproteobacteria bacterium]
MLESLRIERLAVVDAVEIEFRSGLNVLTGETGAGKSIVLSALGLLAGGRASQETIRDGADDALVEAVFATGGLAELAAALSARGLEVEDDSLIVRRTLSRAGRNRARVAGETVPVARLGELFGGRLEISSQHESQALLRPEAQGRLLDAFGGLDGPRGDVARAYAHLHELDAEVARLREAADDRARREDFLAFQVNEIDDAGLEAGEYAELSAERSRLGHADQIRGEVARAVAALSGDPTASDALGAGDLLGQAARAVDGLVEVDPSLAELAQRLHAVGADLGEAASDLERHADGVDADPARLAAVEDRLDRLERLRRKYGEDETRILTFRDEAATELATLRGAEEGLAKLESERGAALAALARAAEALTAGRTKAAGKLSRAGQKAIRGLALAEARFAVALDAAPGEDGLPCGPNGAETPVFRFSADPGVELRDLRRVASGGELSRVFLALKNVLRRSGAGMVLVFDEVDAGIGGAVADRVGAALAELAREHQVLCITHLPQVAARADHHLRVRKHTTKGRSSVSVECLEGEARVDEIARMAGGAEVGEATRQHARELLESGR